MVFTTFSNLSWTFSIRSSWYEPQSAPGLVFTGCIELVIFECKKHSDSDFGIDQSDVCVELSPGLLEKHVCYDQHVLLTKLCCTLPYFILYSKDTLACYSRYRLASYFCIPVSYKEVDIFFGVAKGVVGLHRTGQLHLFWYQWFAHTLKLL